MAAAGRPCSVGVSKDGTGPRDIPLLYEQARVALRVGLRLRGNGTVTSFAGLGLYRLISNVSEGELRAFVHDTLGPVLDLTEPVRSDLLKSLAVLASTRSHGRVRPPPPLPLQHHALQGDEAGEPSRRVRRRCSGRPANQRRAGNLADGRDRRRLRSAVRLGRPPRRAAAAFAGPGSLPRGARDHIGDWSGAAAAHCLQAPEVVDGAGHDRADPVADVRPAHALPIGPV